MINIGRLVNVFACVMLTLHWTAASDLVNGLTFSNTLIERADDVLGVKKMQEIIDERAEIYTEKTNGKTTVQTVTQSLSSKFNDALKALDRIVDAILVDYNTGNLQRVGIKRCCQMTNSKTEYNFLFKSRVDMKNLCYRIAAESKETEQVPTSINLLDTFRTNFGEMRHVKWQYFGTDGGLVVTYPARRSGNCGVYDPRFRPWYVTTATQLPKDIVIIVDRSDSMNENEKLIIAKEATQTVIGTLNPNDRIGMVGWFSGDVTTMSGCYSTELAYATIANKKALNAYVDEITADGDTNYIQPLEKAFGLLEDKETITENRKKVILFVVDGGAANSQSFILKKIGELNGRIGNEVVILTYGIGDLDSSAKRLLTAMANQTESDPDKGNIKRGRFTQINHSTSLKVSIGTYYNIFSKHINESKPVITAPYVDYSGLGIVVSVCKAVYKHTKLLGVAAVDLRLTDLLTKATYYDGGDYSYAFIIDNTGLTLIHPLLLKPSVSASGRTSVDISSLEPTNVIKNVISSMKSGGEGERELYVNQVQSRGNPYKDGVNSFEVKATYHWKPIERTAFSVCIVVTENSHITKTRSHATATQFVYHRLDLRHQVALCSIRKKKLATRESSVVKLTGNAFVDPNKYFNINEQKSTVEKYEDYMTGKAVAGNNIKDGVRQSVALSEDLDKVWKSRGGSFWRYVGFITGVMRMYPGPIFATNYDHTIRRWYQSAIAHRDVTVLTPPYIDALGNGIVLSLCRALYLTKRSQTHSPKDTVVGVIAMDFKLANIKTMLSQLFPACNQSDLTCFLVDTSGFLVYHDDFIKPTNKRLVSVHIAEKEMNIASDLIQNAYMTPGSCLGIVNKKIYNTWRININSKIDKLQDSFLAYSLEVVPTTNVFLGVKKTNTQTRDMCGSCPNTADGELHRCPPPQGTTRCQCPCFLEAGFQSCKNIFESKRDVSIPCTPVEEHVTYSSPVKNETTWAEQYPSCYATECTVITIKSECVSYDDCEWCVGDVSTESKQPCQKRGKCPPTNPISSGFGIGGIIGVSLGAVCLLAGTITIAAVVVSRQRCSSPENATDADDYDSVVHVPETDISCGFSVPLDNEMRVQNQRESISVQQTYDFVEATPRTRPSVYNSDLSNNHQNVVNVH